MATQEPNVYAGLAVVVGGLMHARPRMFAKVMGELMFWLGEDRLVFGSDYAIWEPKWQVEGFAAWNMPEGEEFSDYSPAHEPGQEEDLRAQRRPAVRPRRPDDAAHPGGRAGSPGAVVIDPSPVRAALDTVRDPELDTSIVELGFVTACSVDDDGTARVRLRLPTFFCAPNFAFLMVADAYDAVARRGRRHRRRRSCWRTTSPPRRSTPAWPRGPGSSPRSTVSPRASSTSSAGSSSARRCSPRRTAWLRPLLAAGVDPEELAAAATRRRSRVGRPRPAAGAARGAGHPGGRRRSAARPHGRGEGRARRGARPPPPLAHGQGEHRRQRRLLPPAPRRALRPREDLISGLIRAGTPSSWGITRVRWPAVLHRAMNSA